MIAKISGGRQPASKSFHVAPEKRNADEALKRSQLLLAFCLFEEVQCTPKILHLVDVGFQQGYDSMLGIQ